MMDIIGEILGRVIIFLQLSVVIAITILTPIVILYFLSKVLIHLFSNYKNSSKDTEAPLPFLKIKIVFTIFGIIYCLLIFSGIILMFFEPSWFHPPVWLKIFSIVVFVPYFACVFGLLGLGNIGHSDFSQWKDFKILLKKSASFIKAKK